MLCHSIVDSLKRMIVPAVIFSSSHAAAEGFTCQKQADASDSWLVCQDEPGNDSQWVAQVALRKMPRWGVHAGLTVIDLCLSPRAELGTRLDDSLKIDSLVDPKLADKRPTRVCERRYCTDVKKQFSLFLNSVPIPIGWSTVSFWIGFRNTSFAIRCDEVLSHVESQEDHTP